MKKTSLIILLLFLVSNMNIEAQQRQLSTDFYLNNRSPLITKPYMELPLGAVQPKGWLKDQMVRMKNGMTGHLDSLYPEVMGPRNGWLGGDGDVWERGPYWIDGLLPLAYILDDETLKAKVQPWVEWTLQSQQQNGYFGPSMDREPEAGLQRTNAHDWWPKMVVLKFMKQYYEATYDERVIPFMLNYFRYQLKELPLKPLNHWTRWGQQRGGDNLMIVYWLYNITGEKFLLKLGDLITEQTIDWTNAFLEGDMLNTLFSVHCVNLAQGMKQPVIRYQASKDQKHIYAVHRGMKDLKRAHGWPNGLYGADELLHTGNPTQGSELCTAVELMFSLEKMIEITGSVEWADWLEKITFNALPTQITDDFDARQYYQQLNQVEVSRHPRNFVTCYHGTDQLFGLLTGYPCCTSNLHQGWPKFTKHLWYASEDKGLAALFYSPCTITAKVGTGTTVKIEEITNYPFEESVRFTIDIIDQPVETVMFPLHLRIPEWCNEATIKINNKIWKNTGGGIIEKVHREWKSGDVVELLLPMEVKVSRWHEASAAIERGPLLYALRMEENWIKVEDDRQFGTRYGEWYYEVHSDSPWNYCLKEESIRPENIETDFQVIVNEVKGYPWNVENAPVEIKTKGKRMIDWQLYNRSAGPLPFSVQYQAETMPEEEIILIPYGCTTLRIAEFPVTRQ
ncbi:putative beta-L-arabinofuranosidase [Proteiniphilum saccharofermentans]|uniref:Putative beta-L-arabinofuranosidase n=1 Tax=Proteiniphilum saccharofermentans TaxID=1642647 RepID=A0A1R3T2K5_9BACT|nr:beta-L-arabinofuranosidase domain-containing protein [Proteiniphilum saccharofermentans]SCD21951.1 putative beta-L-arabinofuranosidase [Proteiniphilum saccharofermentans]